MILQIPFFALLTPLFSLLCDRFQGVEPDLSQIRVYVVTSREEKRRKMRSKLMYIDD